MADSWEPPASWDIPAQQLSAGARRVLFIAHQEARRLNHNYVGTEHLLLGLVQETGGVAAHVLSNLGVNLNRLYSALESIIGQGKGPSQEEIRLTNRAKRAVDLAAEEARRMNYANSDTEHLLIGLLREGKGVAAGVLIDPSDEMLFTSEGVVFTGKRLPPLVTLDQVVSETYRVLGLEPPSQRRNSWRRFFTKGHG